MSASRRARRGRAALCAVIVLCLGALARAAASGWSDDEVRASRVQSAAAPAGEPRASADPARLLVVPDGDGRHLTLVDDERLEIVQRVATRPLLAGTPKRSPDGRHVYVASTDGWIAKLDLRSLAAVAEVRAGLELRDIALSSDGQWLLAGNVAPHGVAIFDADLRLVKSFVAAPRDAPATSRVAAVADAAPRQSFVVVLQDIPEIWEISYNPRAEDIYDGLVHDYRMAEGVPMRGFLNRRRSLLAAPLTAEARNVAFDPEFTSVLGAVPARDGGGWMVQVVNLDVRRRIATVALPAAPRLNAAIAVDANGRRALAVPSATASAIDVIDSKSWQLARTVATPAPLQFLSLHDVSPFVWAIAAPADRGRLLRLDPATLQAVVGDAEAAAHRSCGAPLLGRGGGHAWMRPCAGDAGLLVDDARTLQPLRRLELDPAATPR